MLQTSFGNVKILDFKIPVDNGKWIAGKLFKPNSASAKNKVPIVITCAGYLNNNQMQDSSAIELSRRGIAVMAMDAYFHGDSSSSENSVIDSTLREGTGMIPMVEFAYSQLDYIDTSRIGVMGHSMGGMDVWITLAHYGAQYNAAIAAARDPSSDGGAAITPKEQAAAEAQNKVCAGLASGNVRLSTPEFFQNIHANFAINYGKYDEGCYDLKRGNGDLSGACYESLSAVNSALPEGKKIASVEIGRLYGNAVDKSLRVVFNPPATHQMQHFSVRSTADNVTFFTSAFRMPPVMDARNQLWLLKEVFNGLGLIACLFAIVPIALLLLRLPAFAELVTPLPQALPALSSRKRKTVFWGGWILSWVVSWLSFMPVAKLDLVLFKGTATMGFASWFPQQTTNFIMLWAIFNGIVGLALFWGSYRLFGKKDGVTPEMWGIRTNAREILKTLVLAACVFVGFYAIAFGAEYFFHTDFRFWVVAICTFASKKLLIALEYIPLYFIFFAASSILTNSVNRVEGRKEWLNLLVCGLGNVLGIVALNAVQYVTLFATGAAHWQADRLYPLLAIPLIVPLFAAAYINRRLYTATGKVWLGAMVNCLIIVMIGVANTATLLPL
jgi:dienelactone hydrolase